MSTGRPITGRMVLVGMLAFFGVIFAANGALVFFALDSWPGLSTEKAYEEGVAYNRTLEAQAVQARLGWSSAVAFTATKKDGVGPAKGLLGLRLTGPNKSPVTGVDVRVHVRRPVREGFDVTIALKETAPGRYAAPLAVALAGRWYADVDVRRKGKPVYRLRHEIMVTP